MIRRILSVVTVLLIVLINTSPVLAGTITDLVNMATPITSGGIIDFTVTAPNENQLDFSWVFGENTTAIMIRGRFGNYPNDIPDINTAPSDGFLIYNGNGTEASYYFDENISDLFIKAWGQSSTGEWIQTTDTYKKGSAMTLIGLVFFAGILSYLALKTPFRLFALLAGGAWLGFALYLKSNPPGSLVEGSSPHVAIWVVIIGVAIALPLYALGREVQTQKSFGDGLQVNKIFSKWNLGFGDIGKDKDKVSPVMQRRQKLQDYRDSVHKALYPSDYDYRGRRRR